MESVERRALMGDKKAQEECTQRGIALTCPFCGEPQEVDFKVNKVHHLRNKCIFSNKFIDLEDWNTRQSLPIGRCGECANGILDCDIITCTLDKYNHYKHDFCSEFEPKTSDKNER